MYITQHLRIQLAGDSGGGGGGGRQGGQRRGGVQRVMGWGMGGGGVLQTPTAWSLPPNLFLLNLPLQTIVDAARCCCTRERLTPGGAGVHIGCQNARVAGW